MRAVPADPVCLTDRVAQAEGGHAAEWMRAGRKRWGDVVGAAGMRLE